MDVNYLKSDWDRVKQGIAHLMGGGSNIEAPHGAPLVSIPVDMNIVDKGAFGKLIEVSENLEDAASQIQELDSDNAITFSHINHQKKYEALKEDFSVLKTFSQNVGGIVNDTIDEPFYKDLDDFVASIGSARIEGVEVGNRLNALEVKVIYNGRQPEVNKVKKEKINLKDILSGDNYYGNQLKKEFDIEQEAGGYSAIEEYRNDVLNSRAFAYDSIRNQQEGVEFWWNMGRLATLAYPPVGVPLNIAASLIEGATTLATGKHMISGRDLNNTDILINTVGNAADMVGAGAAVRGLNGSFRTAGAINDANKLNKFREISAAARSQASKGSGHVGRMISDAGLASKTRFASVKKALADGYGKIKDKVVKDSKEVKEWTQQGLNLVKKPLSQMKGNSKGRLVYEGVGEEAGIIRSRASKDVNLNTRDQKKIDMITGNGRKHLLEDPPNLKGGRSKQKAVNSEKLNTGNAHRSEIDEVIKKDYDIDGNLINRSVVPKGYDSVEDFLKLVDDTSIKEFGYDSIEEFKAVVGHVDDYLNASPKNNIINKGLAGGKHVKGVDYDVLGFPIFKGDDVKFSLKLKEGLFKATDDTQFKKCTGLLKKAVEQGEIPKDIFTPKQLRDIENGEARIKGLTWHHHQVPGKMQLVVSKTHKVNHLGGNKLWGDGIR